MRRKKLFIYTVLAAVLLSAALGIGAKTIHERIINGKEPADNHTTAPLVDVDVTKGQPGEKIKNPLPEWNTLISGSYDEEGKIYHKMTKKGKMGLLMREKGMVRRKRILLPGISLPKAGEKWSILTTARTAIQSL